MSVTLAKRREYDRGDYDARYYLANKEKWAAVHAKRAAKRAAGLDRKSLERAKWMAIAKAAAS